MYFKNIIITFIESYFGNGSDSYSRNLVGGGSVTDSKWIEMSFENNDRSWCLIRIVFIYLIDFI